MEPICYEFLMRKCFALGNFIFMVREEQINPSRMNIKLFTQILHAHCRTLNMPSWSTLSKWRVPPYISIIGSPTFPKREILHIIF